MMARRHADPAALDAGPVDRTKYLPPLLLELVEAAEAGGDLVPAVLAIVRKLGFDGFFYATASYHLRPNNDERIYYFTTLPREWVIRYDQRAYVECDPRVLYSFESALPLVWDQASERGKNPKTDAFLLDAAANGVGSGVAFPVYAGYPARTLVSLSHSMPIIDDARRMQIAANLGNIVIFGQCFHEVFVKGGDRERPRAAFRGHPVEPARTAVPPDGGARDDRRRHRVQARDHRTGRYVSLRQYREQARRAQSP